MLSDLRLAVRSLSAQWLLALAVIATVALAIGVNTALFSVFDGLLFRPLPYPDADRLVAVTVPFDSTISRKDREATIAGLTETELFSDRAWARATLLFEEGSESVTEWGLRAVQVSPNVFQMLGVTPIHGRLLAREDEGRVSPRPILMSHDLWRALWPAVVASRVEPSVALRDI